MNKYNRSTFEEYKRREIEKEINKMEYIQKIEKRIDNLLEEGKCDFISAEVIDIIINEGTCELHLNNGKIKTINFSQYLFYIENEKVKLWRMMYGEWIDFDPAQFKTFTIGNKLREVHCPNGKIIYFMKK